MLKSIRTFSSSRFCRGLEEFFDTKKGFVWKADDLPTGRGWTCAEVRLKSFQDLHKLWWVCIKQQNLLLTQREEAKRFKIQFPLKTRLAQVRDTMKNIKLVLWERKIAWEQSQDILLREKAKMELVKTGTPKEDILEQVAQSVPIKRLPEHAAAAALGVEKLLQPVVGGRRARRAMFGYGKKQLIKKSSWFTI